MLFSDLALILTIMINALIFYQSSQVEGIIAGKEQSNFYPRDVLKRFNYLDVNGKIQRFPGKNGRTNKTMKMRQKKWFLDPLKSKLTAVINRYEEKGNFIKTIYRGVLGCGLNKCEKFHGLIPENQLIGHVRCFRRNFKKMISNKLLKFDRGVRIIEKTFQDLIYFEETSRFCNSSRRTFLKELKIDMIMLSQEIQTVMNERLNFSRQPEILTSTRLPHPEYETHLVINEWRIIQDSKQFLREWQENFQKMFKCWKKRQKRRKIKRLIQNSSSPQPHLIHSFKFSKISRKRKL